MTEPKADAARSDPREALGEAIEAAAALGLDVSEARSVAREIDARLGLFPDAYVLALVGGTGVGKSSILNAIAGEAVSAASARRPTTGRPVAWVSEAAAPGVGPLLDRLGVGAARRHRKNDLDGVVVLDLPDVDSLEPSHRSAVEELLPRVDAVAWVLDPEKYADALLHDAFLTRWVRRLARQVVVLNKIDRLSARDAVRVRADLVEVLAGELGDLAAVPPIVATTASAGAAGVVPLVTWLRGASDAKAVVAERLSAAATAATEDLASAAGVAGEDVPLPLLPEAERDRVLRSATAEILRVIDLRGAERQAIAATRARARPRGAGPLGRLTSFLYRASGRERRVADPGRYLRAWRDRGSLARAAERVRTAVGATVPEAPRALRPRYAAATELRVVERTLGHAVERAIASEPPLEDPTSRVWTIVGFLQTLTTVLIALAAVWIVVWVILRPPVDSVVLPFLGAVPVPLALLVGSLVTGYLLARVLSIHAGWIGRRWARGIARRIGEAVAGSVAMEAFAPVDAIEAARDRLHEALRRLERPAA